MLTALPTLPTIFSFFTADGTSLGTIILPPASQVAAVLLGSGFHNGRPGNLMPTRTDYSRLVAGVYLLRLNDPQDPTFAKQLNGNRLAELRAECQTTEKRLGLLGQQNLTEQQELLAIDPLDAPTTPLLVAEYLYMVPSDKEANDFFRQTGIDFVVSLTELCTGIAPAPSATIANVLALALAPDAVDLFRYDALLSRLPRPHAEQVLAQLRHELRHFTPSPAAQKAAAAYLVSL